MSSSHVFILSNICVKRHPVYCNNCRHFSSCIHLDLGRPRSKVKVIGSSSIPSESEEIYRAHENGRDGQTLRKHNAPSYGRCQCRRNKSVTQSTRIQCYSLYACTRAKNWKASDLSSFFSYNQEILITKSFLVIMMHLLVIFKQKVSIIFSSLCASSTLICTLSTVYVDILFSVVSQKC